jgi:hypothetical protein
MINKYDFFEDQLDVYIEYRGLKVNKMFLEYEKKRLDEEIDKLIGKGKSYKEVRTK